jgi:plasmid stabilization system protein ParE
MPVYLSQTAYDQLHQILDYLEEKWYSQVSDNFLDKLERTMESIGRFPYSFPPAATFPAFENVSSISRFLRITELTK